MISLVVVEYLKLAYLAYPEMKPDKFKTYELIRGHKLTVVADLEQNEIKEMVNKAIKWYNSMD